jgi:hypothetical protein
MDFDLPHSYTIDYITQRCRSDGFQPASPPQMKSLGGAAEGGHDGFRPPRRTAIVMVITPHPFP